VSDLIPIPNSGGWLQNITLTASSVCSSNIGSGYSTPTYTDSDYGVYAWKDGFWNATVYTVSPLSAWNDFRQMGLEQNYESYTVPGVAFSHSTYADCGVAITQTITQSVSAYLAGSGYTDSTTWTTAVTANPVSDGDSAIDLHQYTSGAMNETGSPVVRASYAVGETFDPSADAISPTDWLSAPPSGETYPIPNYPGYQVYTVGETGGSISYKDGGSFQVTTGIALSIQIGLTGGWQGVPVGVSGGVDIPLAYETTDAASSGAEISCSLTDNEASQGMNAQYYYYVDGTNSGSQEAVNMHVWFDDYCVPNNSTCN